MSQGTAPDSAMWSLRTRGPAHAVSHTCLETQTAARPRSLITRIAGADPLHPDAVVWYQRALAEGRVARILADLGPEYRVLHAIPEVIPPGSARGKTFRTAHPQCAGEHIDHLVIGPPGVFAITTASHPRERLEVGRDTLLADGQRTTHLPTAEREARAAADSLARATGAPVAVTPVVVVVGAREIRVLSAAAPLPVAVVSVRELAAWARARSVVLGPDQVASIARAAEEWTTWRPLTAELGIPTDPAPQFERLHAEVVGARRVRFLWFAGSVAALLVVAFGAASGLFA
jgi:hypothetical protein